MKRPATRTAALSAVLVLAPIGATCQAQTTIVPGLSPVCTAVQTAAWNATDDAWDRSKLRPGQIMCALGGVEGFCVSSHCRAEAGIVIMPPVSLANPTAERRLGKVGLGRAPTEADIRDRFPNAERATFSKAGQMVMVSISSKDPAYAKQLMAAIRKGVR